MPGCLQPADGMKTDDVSSDDTSWYGSGQVIDSSRVRRRVRHSFSEGGRPGDGGRVRCSSERRRTCPPKPWRRRKAWRRPTAKMPKVETPLSAKNLGHIRVQVFLETCEHLADLVRLAQIAYSVGDGVVVFETE